MVNSIFRSKYKFCIYILIFQLAPKKYQTNRKFLLKLQLNYQLNNRCKYLSKKFLYNHIILTGIFFSYRQITEKFELNDFYKDAGKKFLSIDAYNHFLNEKICL
ncbi:hypothetical protein EDEG_03150 [Edhazardia aedis USNM 41457]|uniref:Uncharacterized protein n=1 Tax=Edhazardia aedis (strain USNM 41457) TaxID=1003232 RepID=J9D3N5_EDHAE|nr:hypothetical protein EDEG_03150 [Edhazardia aedis USNM 41457]|eukprot:EJW02446.1 hypothetical protein EDEG_03150 [Edhazardia aedis USNM 41457]